MLLLGLALAAGSVEMKPSDPTRIVRIHQTEDRNVYRLAQELLDAADGGLYALLCFGVFLFFFVAGFVIPQFVRS